MISDGVVNHLYERCSLDSPVTLHKIISQLLNGLHTAVTLGYLCPACSKCSTHARHVAHTTRSIAVLVRGGRPPTCTMEWPVCSVTLRSALALGI